MLLTRLRQLLVVNVSEIYQSEQEILRQLPLMAARSGEPALRELFDAHYRETQRQIARLTAIFDLLDERCRPTSAPAMRGLVDEARLREAFLEPGDLLDLALIDIARRVEHYEIAAYSMTAEYARRIGNMDIVGLLQDSLDEERRADGRLERLVAPARVHAA